eukprot:scaffold26.g3355.t1
MQEKSADSWGTVWRLSTMLLAVLCVHLALRGSHSSGLQAAGKALHVAAAGQMPQHLLAGGAGVAGAAAPARVLAVVVGGWALPGYRSPQRYALLRRALLSYTDACEAGLDVDVVLITYEGWNTTLQAGAWDPTHLWCERTMAQLNVSVVLFQHEKLPPGTFGTAGTLAFQHRRLFLAARDAYDLFVVQEDDMAIRPHHLLYYLRWSERFLGTDFVPSFVQFEVPPPSAAAAETGGRAAAQGAEEAQPWRRDSSSMRLEAFIKSLTLLRWRGRPYLARLHNCCFHMLTRAQLAAATANASAWLGYLHEIKGEFNPQITTAAWLEPRARFLLPLEDLHLALVHHGTNRYSTSYEAKAANISGLYNLLTFGEVVHLLATCEPALEGPHLAARVARHDTPRIAASADCGACLSAGPDAAVRLLATKPWAAQTARPGNSSSSGGGGAGSGEGSGRNGSRAGRAELRVKVRCLKRQDIKWRNYKGAGGFPKD